MELRQLRYFLVVAEEMHFRRAAERLHLAQPSLTVQIQNLEEELGVKLFERSNRRVRLTAAGERFLKEARQILLGVTKAVQSTKDVADGIAGTLSIGFVSTALVGVLPCVLRSFIAQTPGVDIELEEMDPEDQIHSIVRGRADVGFVHGVVSDPQLATLIVESDQLMVAVPTKLASRKKIHLAALSEYTTILPAPFSSYGFSEHVRQAYELAGTSPRKSVHVKLLLVGIHLVASGIGICLVPKAFRTIPVRGVVYRPLAIEPPPLDLLAVWRRDSESKPLQRFLQVLRKEHTDCREDK